MTGKADFKKPKVWPYCCWMCDGPEKKYKKVRARRTRRKLNRQWRKDTSHYLKAEQSPRN